MSVIVLAEARKFLCEKGQVARDGVELLLAGTDISTNDGLRSRSDQYSLAASSFARATSLRA
jgi:hypothetical protein